MYRILHIPTGTLLTRSGKDTLSFYSKKEASRFLRRFFKLVATYNKYVWLHKCVFGIPKSQLNSNMSRAVAKYDKIMAILDQGMELSSSYDIMAHRNSVTAYGHVLPLYLIVTGGLSFFTSFLIIDKCEFLIVDDTNSCQ